TGTGTTGDGLSRAALVHSQANVATIQHLHEADVDASWEVGVTSQRDANLLHSGAVEVIHHHHSVGVTNGQRVESQVHRLAGDVDATGVSGCLLRLERQTCRAEAGSAHVYHYQPIFLNTQYD